MVSTEETNNSIDIRFNEFIGKRKISGNLTNVYIKRHLIEGFERFKKFLKVIELETGIQIKNCSDITENTVFEFIKYLQTQKTLKSRTIKTYLNDIAPVLRYFMKKKYTEKFEIPVFKVRTEPKEIFNVIEIFQMLKKPNFNKDRFTRIRNWTIINYRLSRGNRPRSILNINYKTDIVLKDKYLILRKTKNGKQQIVSLENTMIRILKKYLSIRKKLPGDMLFCDESGNPLQECGFHKGIRKYYKELCNTKKKCKSFRATFATYFLLYSKRDIYTLSSFMGHSNIAITENYINKNLLLVDILKYKGKSRQDILQIFYEQRRKYMILSILKQAVKIPYFSVKKILYYFCNGIKHSTIIKKLR